jgi:ATP-dependent Clp protease ATP-binding subunit ClpC
MWFPRLLRPEPTQPPVTLTEDARQVFDAAVRAARRCKHEYVGTEHLLIGIIEGGPTPAAEALERAGIAADSIRQYFDSAPGLGQVPGALPFTPTAIRVLRTAQRSAKHAGATAVGSLDLLVALASDEEGLARELLARVVAAEVSDLH